MTYLRWFHRLLWGAAIAFYSAVIVNGLLQCRHKSVSWPQHGHQSCNDCAATRTYEIGQRPGRWRK